MHANNQSDFVHGFDNALMRDDEYDALVRDDGYDKAKYEFRRLSRNGWVAPLLPSPVSPRLRNSRDLLFRRQRNFCIWQISLVDNRGTIVRCRLVARSTLATP